MKGGEMSLIAQLFLESSTGAYLERIVNKVKLLLIKLDFKDELLVTLFAKQNKPASHIAYHVLESREIYSLVG
jgi:hypothetical protein